MSMLCRFKMAYNVSANTAVAFAAYQQINLLCGKSNGTNTTNSFTRIQLSHTIK